MEIVKVGFSIHFFCKESQVELSEFHIIPIYTLTIHKIPTSDFNLSYELRDRDRIVHHSSRSRGKQRSNI